MLLSVNKTPPVKSKSAPKFSITPFASTVRLPEESVTFPFRVTLSVKSNFPAPAKSIPCVGTVKGSARVKVFPESTESLSFSARLKFVRVESAITSSPLFELLAADAEA